MGCGIGPQVTGADWDLTTCGEVGCSPERGRAVASGEGVGPVTFVTGSVLSYLSSMESSVWVEIGRHTGQRGEEKLERRGLQH